MLLTLLIVFFFGGREARGVVQLMDGRLLLKGSFDEFWLLRTYIPKKERAWHDSNIGTFLSTARFETFCNLVQKDDLKINLQSIFRYYYEGITDLDRSMHSALAPGKRREFQTPSYRHDDPIAELYLEVRKGRWNVRAGKQIVTWGETSLKRTTDVVNPLDLRHGQPGYMSFEDLKIGLWMLQCFYESELPGGLLFETIFIPCDHQMMRIPPSGTNWGAGLLNPDNPRSIANGLFPMFLDEWKDDAPSRRSISDYQWGIRIRGIIKRVDWTLQYFDAVDFLPTGIPNRVNQQTFAYFLSGGDIGNTKVADRIWSYKRTKYVGGILRWLEEEYFKGVIRAEVGYQIGKHYNTVNLRGKDVYVPPFSAGGLNWPGGYSDQTSLVTGVVKRDAFGFGLAFDRPIQWPWLMKYNDGRVLSVTFQFFEDWILRHSRDLSISGRGRGDRNVTGFSLQLQTTWFHQELTTTSTSFYDASGTGYNGIDFTYAPGDHWRYQTGFLFFYSFTQWDQEANSYDKDMFYFRVKYEW